MSIERKLVNAWFQKKVWLWSLLPLSTVFFSLSWLRRQYLKWWVKTEPYEVPVLVVGNISVGGSGKTPFIIALVKRLQKKGYVVGVVSRGYGGTAATYPLVVSADTSPSLCGDEPLLISTICKCTVVVDPLRVRAVNALVEHFSCDIILSDDGLQHYRMHRDVEVAIVDVDRGFGNGLMLPAGPLREPISRLKTVDFVVLNGKSGNQPNLADSQESYSVSIEPDGLRKFGSDVVIGISEWSLSKQVHAVAGIGHPERFAETLVTMGFNPSLSPKNDHQSLTSDDLNFGDSLALIITAK
ncbi:MAG: tetraacyldisaccharide 4'-kinase, partial [Porticoccaceae bacterium]|nr:tetraacyldisaccharide 4'-kinase [Porticoccaceae bacterium]